MGGAGGFVLIRILKTIRSLRVTQKKTGLCVLPILRKGDRRYHPGKENPP